jgi:hypothetical protein
MKKFMTLGAPTSGDRLVGDLGGKSVAPVLGEVEVMTIFG